MTQVETIAAPVINQFPALVLHPDGTATDKARAVVNANLLVVYTEEMLDGGRRRPHTEFTVNVASMHPDPDAYNAWVVVDSDGNEWRIRKGHGCGCHSPLKNMSAPFPVNL